MTDEIPYLSYSGRATYLTCPKQYHFRYILMLPEEGDTKRFMFGSAIGKLFEWFYNRKLWAQPDSVVATLALVSEAIDETCTKQRYHPFLNSEYLEDMRKEIVSLVPKVINMIIEHQLLTERSYSEFNLKLNYKSMRRGMEIKLGGKADFIHYRPREIWILDGKSSEHKERYVDSEQLIWYAVMHYLKYRVAPTRLGFLFYRFMDKEPVKWIQYDESHMRASLDLTFETIQNIRDKKFEAKPSGECHGCFYASKCEEGQKYIRLRRKETSGGPMVSDIFELDPV